MKIYIVLLWVGWVGSYNVELDEAFRANLKLLERGLGRSALQALQRQALCEDHVTWGDTVFSNVSLTSVEPWTSDTPVIEHIDTNEVNMGFDFSLGSDGVYSISSLQDPSLGPELKNIRIEATKLRVVTNGIFNVDWALGKCKFFTQSMVTVDKAVLSGTTNPLMERQDITQLFRRTYIRSLSDRLKDSGITISFPCNPDTVLLGFQQFINLYIPY